VIVVAALSLGAPRLVEPSTIILLQAVRDLGPISGWRCAQSATYTYDPRRERADSTLLSDAPDEVLKAQVPGLEVDSVEANLRGGDTVIWARVVSNGDSTAAQAEERRVYVLSPGRQLVIGNELAANRPAICYSALGDWRIVAEHGLQ
jgi:hypothetical protein